MLKYAYIIWIKILIGWKNCQMWFPEASIRGVQ